MTQQVSLSENERELLAVLFDSHRKNKLTTELIKSEVQYWGLEDYENSLKSLLGLLLLKYENGEYEFTESGIEVGKLCRKKFVKENFDQGFIKHYKSKVFRKFCKDVHDVDFFLFSMINKYQIEVLEKEASFRQSDDVLDIGCGPGDLLEYLHDKYGFSSTGIDFAAKTIKMANERVAGKKNIVFREFDIEELSEMRERFDKIIAVDSLYFSKNLPDVIKNISGLLKPAGKAYVFFTNFEGKIADEYLNKLGIRYSKIDLTEQEIMHWKKTIEIAEKYKEEFEKEGSLGIYEGRMSEAKEFITSDYNRCLYIFPIR